MLNTVSGYAIALENCRFLESELLPEGPQIFDTTADALKALHALESWAGECGEAMLYALVPQPWPDEGA